MISFLKKTLIVAAVIFTIAAAGWYGRKAYSKASENRLVSHARNFFAKKDFQNTAICLQRALQLNPFSIESSRIMADLMDEVGSPAAIGWRMRVVQLEPGN